VGTDLVLASKEQHVARRVSQLFPKTTNARFTAAHSRVGFSAGGEAGSRASLNLGEKNLSHSRRAVATH
jgi:hypothetical protein